MPAIFEESETEYPSFSMKKRGGDGANRNLGRGDSEFDDVIDQVLEENKNAGRRDDLTDDDDDLAPDRTEVNPLKDFTFVGGSMDLMAKPKQQPKKLDSITAIRDYLESELGQDRLYQAYPVLRDFGDDMLYEEKTAELVEKLEFCMTAEEVEKYRNFFSLLVFHDMTVDQNGGGEDAMILAGQTLRGISNMTAAFGQAPLRETRRN